SRRPSSGWRICTASSASPHAWVATSWCRAQPRRGASWPNGPPPASTATPEHSGKTDQCGLHWRSRPLRDGDLMFGNAFQGWHLLIILVVILLLFGAAKLPALAKSMGQSARVFKGE